MAKKEYLIHKRSSVSGQLPSNLEYGEIAVNYANGNEFISIKNSNNSIVMFPTSGIITTAIVNAVSAETVRATSAETILQENINNEVINRASGDTVEAQARLQKDTELENAINEYKLTVAAALNDLQNRVTSLESRVTALEP